MNILGTEYNLMHRALEIYLAGCNPPHCPGCHSQASWDFNAGTKIDYDRLYAKVEYFGSSISQVWVMGGEPTDQPIEELEYLLSNLQRTNKTIILWTRKELEQIDNRLFKYVDYIKTGMYREDLPGYQEGTFGIMLASDNQQIIKKMTK